MIRFLIAGLSLAMLAGCGADGAPERPTAGEPVPTSGVTVSGDLTVGVIYQ